MRRGALHQCYAVVGLLVGRAIARCNRDECLQDVVATNFPHRDGFGDCNSFLRTTVIPVTRTFYSTTIIVATTSTTTTDVDSFATVIVIPETTTSTKSTTTTEHTIDTVSTDTSTTTVIDETVTATSDVATVTVTDTNTVAVARRSQVGPRPVTVTPTAIPPYASSCRSPSEYSSACRCFCAKATTITDRVPSTTIVVRKTIYKTSTILSTLSTTSSQSSTSKTTTVETGTTTTTAVELATDSTTLTTDVISTTVLLATSSTTTTTATTLGPHGNCPFPTLVNGGFESDTISPWIYSNFGNNVLGSVDTIPGRFSPHSGRYYFQVTNNQATAVEARLAQSAYFCSGVDYTITYYANGYCNGKSCERDLLIQVVTSLSNSPVATFPNNEYSKVAWTFTWGGSNGLSPILFDLFIVSNGEAIALDDISIDFAS